jgi:hypothetical protein
MVDRKQRENRLKTDIAPKKMPSVTHFLQFPKVSKI